jgi:pimeloyl-ACP methyl ester carboxylesterase
MGGFVGAEVAIHFSTRVEKLVLVSAAGLSVEHMRNDRALAGLQRLDELLIFVGSQVAGRSRALMSRPRGRRLLMGFVVTHPELLAPAFIAEQVKGTGKPGFVPALDALTSYPIRDRLNEIQSPTLVVWGDSDRIVPTKDAYEFDRLIPDSRLVVYRDTGHCPQMERPDAFNALVDQFLRE